MSKNLKRILLGLLIVLVGIQFIRPSQKVPQFNPASTFEALSGAPDEIVDLLEVGCYDCHSYQTKYPWYANVAPVSWVLGNHIREGREHLNFTLWGSYNPSEKIHKLEEAMKEVREGHMPLQGYVNMHPGANLSQARRDQLILYFVELKEELQLIPEMPTFLPTN